MNSELINFCIQKKMENQQMVIRYYRDGYFPELRECTGSSQEEYIERAERAVDDFRICVLDYRKTGHFQYLKFTKSELLNYIRLYAIEQRELAEQWTGANVYIEMRALRTCVTAVKTLKELEPKLRIYSNSWIAKRTKIHLTPTQQ
jgi:hypothetical protein